MLKSAKLLHKCGLGDSDMSSTVGRETIKSSATYLSTYLKKKTTQKFQLIYYITHICQGVHGGLFNPSCWDCKIWGRSEKGNLSELETAFKGSAIPEINANIDFGFLHLQEKIQILNTMFRQMNGIKGQLLLWC